MTITDYEDRLSWKQAPLLSVLMPHLSMPDVDFVEAILLSAA